MRATLRINYLDDREPFDVECLPLEFTKFEARFDKSVIDAMGGGGQVRVNPDTGDIEPLPTYRPPRLTEVYFLGFLGCQRAHREGRHPGDIKPSFEKWMELIEDVDLVDLDEGDQVPLDGDPPSSAPAS